MNRIHLRAPDSFHGLPNLPTVFLAGSIDRGYAVNWQSELVEKLADTPIIVLNPRRQTWNPCWDSCPNHPTFRQQFEWEQHGLERAQLIAFYFASGGDSPISLLELGLVAGSGKVVVCCHHGFNRKQNVDMVCHRHGIPQVETIDDLATFVRCAAPFLDIDTEPGCGHSEGLGERTPQFRSAA